LGKGTFLAFLCHCSDDQDGKAVKRAGESEDLPERDERWLSWTRATCWISRIKKGNPRIDVGPGFFA